MTRRIVVGVTGASGAPYLIGFLKVLDDSFFLSLTIILTSLSLHVNDIVGALVIAAATGARESPDTQWT